MKVHCDLRLVAIFIVIVNIESITSSSNVLKHPQNSRVSPGSNVTLQCQFSVPFRNCFWNFNGYGIDVETYENYELSKPIGGYCNLIIYNVSLDDDGEWFCLLLRTPIHDAISSNISLLEVIVEPTPPKIIYNGTELKNFELIDATRKNHIEITCETSMGKPASIIYWKIENWTDYSENVSKRAEETNKKLFRTTNVLSLSINYKMDKKLLTCFSRHNENIQNTSIQLNVKYATTIAEIKPDINNPLETGIYMEFTCVADGNPEPRYKWRFKRKGGNLWIDIQRNQSKYSFTVSRETAGVYLCQAGNTGDQLDVWSKEVTVEVLNLQESASLNLPLIGAVVFSFSALTMTTITIIAYFKNKKKPKDDVTSTELKVVDKDVVDSKSVDSVKKSPSDVSLTFPRCSSPSPSIDTTGYMVTRPLPPITTTSEYIAPDPEISPTYLNEYFNDVNIYDEVQPSVEFKNTTNT